MTTPDAETRATALLRQTLAEHAAQTAMPPQLAALARARAHRIVVRRRISAICAAIVCVVVVGGGIALSTAQHSKRNVVTASLLPNWPARGTQVADISGLEKVMQAWDSATKTHHTLKEVLYAGRDSIGSSALLLATDDVGQVRLGGLVGGAGSVWAPTQLVVDQPVTARPTAASLVHQAAGRAPVLLVVTDPRYTRMAWDARDTAMGIASEDDLISGLDLLTFDAWTEIPSVVTLSGSGAPDLQVAINQ
jgi:hypothetical protein